MCIRQTVSLSSSYDAVLNKGQHPYPNPFFEGQDEHLENRFVIQFLRCILKHRTESLSSSFFWRTICVCGKTVSLSSYYDALLNKGKKPYPVPFFVEGQDEHSANRFLIQFLGRILKQRTESLSNALLTDNMSFRQTVSLPNSYDAVLNKGQILIQVFLKRPDELSANRYRQRNCESHKKLF